MIEVKREDDGKKGRFVIYEAGQLAGELTYVWAGDEKLIIDHTEVFEGYSGKGYAKQLVMEAAAFAQDNNLKIVPLCPYANSVFIKDPDLADLKA